jgi:ABC-type transport system substrate-binding protein
MKHSLSLFGRLIAFCFFAALLSACEKSTWNNPYPASEKGKNILYSSFEARPKHLDPVRSYSSNEYAFIGQIYEPPLQYHYLKRPFQLMPQTAEKMPEPVFYSKEGKRLPANVSTEKIAYSIYQIRIKPGILYQPHPAFAKDENGQYLYHNLKEADLEKYSKLSDFAKTGTRELVARDYIYQIKRLAHPDLHSPIFSLMTDYIVGLKQYAAALKKARDSLKQSQKSKYLDLHQYPLEGVKEIDRYTYQIKVKGKYPQLLYWLAMPFFAPMPYEADIFYSQPGMKERNISLDWFPVGTGAYMLTENNPNRKMILERNPNYRIDLYPSEGSKKDKQRGLLVDAGKPMPFIDKVVYSLEKETIPYWNKFLQGYYDVSGVSSDSFDQAIQFGAQGEVGLTEAMKSKGIRLLTEVQASSFYMGFNMLDPVVGGSSKRARKIRQAISIAVDYEDFISIFQNGRGIAAQGPIPPGIFGYKSKKAGMNPYVYDWVNGKRKRKSIQEAKRLLAQAGYPGGRHRKTGKPLLIHLDIPGGGAGDKSTWDWLRKQLKKIDLELIIRNTDYNRFQEKMRKGNAQLYMWGWNADYPDPENFLFLLYGPNGKVKYHGENASNYRNPEYDRLFEKMKNMDNTPERQEIIDRMVKILRHDAPWLWGFHPKSFVLHHAWYKNAKPNQMAHNNLKYKRIDAQLRLKSREAWNRPVLWPVWLLLVVLLVSLIPAVVTYIRSERKSSMMQ